MLSCHVTAMYIHTTTKGFQEVLICFTLQVLEVVDVSRRMLEFYEEYVTRTFHLLIQILDWWEELV